MPIQDGKDNTTAQPFRFQIIGSKKFGFGDKLNWTSKDSAQAYGVLRQNGDPEACLRADGWEKSKKKGYFAGMLCTWDDDESLFPQLFLLNFWKTESGKWDNWDLSFIADLVTKNELWHSLPQYGPVFNDDPQQSILWSKSKYEPTYFNFPKNIQIDPVPNA